MTNNSIFIFVFMALFSLGIFFFLQSSDDAYSLEKETMLSEIKTNKANIIQIKTMLKKIISESDSSSFVDINNTDNSNTNIQIARLDKIYSNLLNEIKSLKDQQNIFDKLLKERVEKDFLQKENILDTNEPENVSFNVQEMKQKAKIEAKKILEQFETDWASGIDDAVATMDTQTALNSSFYGVNKLEEKDISISNVDCKTNACKVTLNFSDTLETSPVQMLREQFIGNNLSYSKQEDPNTGNIEMTLFITPNVNITDEDNTPAR